MKKKDKINLLISIDDGYLHHSYETLLSFKNHNNSYFSVYLLYENLRKETLDSLKDFIFKNNIGELKPVKIDLSNVNLPMNISYISKVTYYRLFAPYYIKEDRLLYVDCDVICTGNILDFYNQDFNDGIIIGCPNMLDSSKMYLDSVMKSNIDISLDDIYINAGVLLINIDNYKNFISEEKLSEFINTTKLPLDFQDQDVINHVFHNHILVADKRYNFQMNGVDRGEEDFNAEIIHYSEYFKPWNNNYFDMRKASPYYDFLLKNGFEDKCYELMDSHLKNEVKSLDNINVAKDPGVDIIIPVYNGLNTLGDCLESIKKQVGAPKIYIYIIDDGSTDNYKKVLDKYNFLNINYVKLDKNKGPGFARNKGLEISKSKYVIFMDADDVFTSSVSVSTLYKLIKRDNVDLVRTTIYRDTDDGYTLYSFDDFGLHGKIYSRDFINKNKIKFNNTRYFEDTGFNLLCYFYDAKISDYDLITYFWKNNAESLSNKKVKYLDLASNLSTNYKLYVSSKENKNVLINYFLSLKWLLFVNDNITGSSDKNRFIKSAYEIYMEFKKIYKGFYYDELYKFIGDRYCFSRIIDILTKVIHFYNDKCGSEALTDFEKSLIELPYLPLDNECAIEQAVYPELIDRYNKLYYSDLEDAMHNLTKSMFKFGYGSKIIPPINSNWGCKNVSVGNCTFINSNVTFVDDAKITIGDNVLIGPNVTFCTSSHPVDLENRRKIISKPITIEDGVWIGANVVILQGVTIGKNSVIGAGSIVTKNVPDNVVAFGNPCKVKKSIND